MEGICVAAWCRAWLRVMVWSGERVTVPVYSRKTELFYPFVLDHGTSEQRGKVVGAISALPWEYVPVQTHGSLLASKTFP